MRHQILVKDDMSMKYQTKQCLEFVNEIEDRSFGWRCCQEPTQRNIPNAKHPFKHFASLPNSNAQERTMNKLFFSLHPLK